MHVLPNMSKWLGLKKRENAEVSMVTTVAQVMPQETMQLSSVNQKGPHELPPMPQLQRMGTLNYQRELGFSEIS